MSSCHTLILFVHLVGIALAVGAATMKNILTLKCNSDPGYIAVYRQVVRSLTKTIIAGMVLLTLTGVTWLITGYPLDTLIIIKMSLFVAVWILGPLVDNVFEPRFFNSAPVGDAAPSAEFIRAKNNYMAIDFLATAVFYAIILMWVLR